MSSCADVSVLQLRTPLVQQDGLPLIFRSRVYLRVDLQLWGCSPARHSLLLLRFLFLITLKEFLWKLLWGSWRGGPGCHCHQRRTRHPEHHRADRRSCRKEITKYEISQSTKAKNYNNINYKIILHNSKWLLKLYEAFGIFYCVAALA